VATIGIHTGILSRHLASLYIHTMTMLFGIYLKLDCALRSDYMFPRVHTHTHTVCYGQDEMSSHLHPLIFTWDATSFTQSPFSLKEQIAILWLHFIAVEC